MFTKYPKTTISEFLQISHGITDFDNVQDLYKKTAQAFRNAHPDTIYPSAEWFRRKWNADHGDQKKEETVPVIREIEPLDLTPQEGMIRKYRSFLRIYRSTGGDQSVIDDLLDATCPEIFEK